jgi:DNA transformation protein
MSVSDTYREFVVESLSRVTPVTARRMFGGVGLYARGLFFALIADDTVYFKVNDTNRADFEARGSGPFAPFGDDAHVMQYYELPADILEEHDTLREWMEKALDVARRAAAQRAPKSGTASSRPSAKKPAARKKATAKTGAKGKSTRGRTDR